MAIYHEIWLQKHPHRSAEWLSERLKDGFHIHHIDGHHANNDPDNLVLIDAYDHARTIHGAPWIMKDHLSDRVEQARLASMNKRLAEGEAAYKEYERTSDIWNVVARRLGIRGNVDLKAKDAADFYGWTWPIKK